MKLPKETTLWNWVIIGLGLIVGVAIIGIMNFLNEFLNTGQAESAISIERNYQPVSGMAVYFAGRIISIITGCFTAGAIIKFARPDIKTISLIVVGLIFMVLSVIDSFMFTYPSWYLILSIVVTIPSVLIGNRLIK